MRERRWSREKRRRRRSSAEGERKRRSPQLSTEERKEEEADGPMEAAEEPSDVEEGGLDLNVPLKPISAFVSERQEMLEQCFRVLGENKLRKMLPDELKSCSMVEIRSLCWDQLQQLSQRNLLQILEGKELIANSESEENEDKRDSVDSQQDNNVDSTSSVKETEDKQGGSGDESDVLSINADVDDSDIEGHKDDKPAPEEAPVTVATAPSESAPPPPPPPPPKPDDQPAEPKLELQHDIDKSVNEILALTTPPTSKAELELPVATEAPLPSRPAATPSAQQLALLELEMRARAIKALMKANELKK
ncbi:caspase activity and apoptosis inhibitor 1 [Astyanax mexicanus]|uniref:Caspase activity and apoptosis inhibitor 1 n=1 Tax=Astyanax mexicanus TaxID=7994 RepID=A0A8B9HNE8_ASTMX|nr:caspase activity and apoptosis inhibitor 1 [Astyanax mexicanus]